MVVPPMPSGSAKSRTNSLWTCLTVSRFCSLVGCCQARLDVPSDQVSGGSMWLGVGGRLWPLAASWAPRLASMPGVKGFWRLSRTASGVSPTAGCRSGSRR